MPRPRPTRVLCSTLVLALAAAAGCSSGDRAVSAHPATGLSSGDAVGQSLFSPEARAIARGEREPSGGMVASFVIESD